MDVAVKTASPFAGRFRLRLSTCCALRKDRLLPPLNRFAAPDDQKINLTLAGRWRSAQHPHRPREPIFFGAPAATSRRRKICAPDFEARRPDPQSLPCTGSQLPVFNLVTAKSTELPELQKIHFTAHGLRNTSSHPQVHKSLIYKTLIHKAPNSYAIHQTKHQEG